MPNSITRKDIDKIGYDLLKQTKGFDVFPTPVDKIVSFSNLYVDNHTDLSSVSNNFFSKLSDNFTKVLKKVRGVLDREKKTIYLDLSVKEERKRFVKLHEVGHEVLPWQRKLYESIGDDDFTLSPEVKDDFEIEANYFASLVLFQCNRFHELASDLPLEISSPMVLAKKFGASNHAAIRRYVETNPKRCALLVLEKNDSNAITMSCTLRNYFQSSHFTKSFGSIKWNSTLNLEDWSFVQDYFSSRRFHKDGELSLSTVNGITDFHYHYFNTTFNAFVLLFPAGEKNKSRTNIIIGASSTKGL
jgi:Zn-dependent peptidase ImmA (M78 family)